MGDILHRIIFIFFSFKSCLDHDDRKTAQIKNTSYKQKTKNNTFIDQTLIVLVFLLECKGR